MGTRISSAIRLGQDRPKNFLLGQLLNSIDILRQGDRFIGSVREKL